LKPAGKIEPQPWMSAPDTVAVFKALAAEGAVVRCVGGCVRDAVLGRPIKDIDLAIDAPPDQVQELLDAAGLKSIPTGIDHGTITALSGGRPYEVTTLRKDVETFGRHARVAFTDDWAEDAARRDFTLNALYCDLDGTLYDPTSGIDDARAGRVRFVGDPISRIKEDRLRVLRFFRFHAWFGKGDPDPEGLAACDAEAGQLTALSAERVRVELLRLLEAPDPAPVVKLMATHGILADILPEATRFDRLVRLVQVEATLGGNDPVRRLGAVLDADGEAVFAITDRLRLSNMERDRLAALLDCMDSPEPEWSPEQIRRTHYLLGDPLFEDRVMLSWAGGEADTDAPSWRKLVDDVNDWQRPEFPLRGADALELGMPSGPEIGDLLKQIESWWIDGDFKADRKACLRELARIKTAANE